MIATASKYVNARIGRPSVNAPNPKYLIPGDKVNIKSRVIGDPVNGNYTWYLTDENELFSAEGFPVTEEMRAIPFYAHQDNRPQLLIDLNISALWENTSMGEKINIGIIDNGVAHHTALKGKVTHLNAHPTNLDPNNHGTTMACIISAFDEAKEKIGIAPRAESIYSYYIDSGTGYFNGEPNDIIMALDQMVAKNVHIINMSFATNKSSFYSSKTDAVLLQEKINELKDKGCVIVCATGNNHRYDLNFYPAKYNNVISVAGYVNENKLDWNSNIWNGVSVCMSSLNYFSDSQTLHSNGTSSAAAIISGCIACMYHKINSSSKIQNIKDIFSKLPTRLKFQTKEITISKFETNFILQQLKYSL